MKKQELIKKLEELRIRSAWMRGVVTIAEMIIEKAETEEIEAKEITTIARDGAVNFQQAVYGGCYLTYDQQIAEAFCNKTELKRTHNGTKYPNAKENWLDVQHRGLIQAVLLLEKLCEV